MATNNEIIQSAYASFAQGDVPAALAAFADDIRWVEPAGHPLGGTYVGPQEVVEGVFMRLAEIGDEFAVVPDQFVASGNAVVALGHLSWKHKSTGAPAMVKMAHVWTFEDGKACCLRTTRRHRQGSRAQLTRRVGCAVGETAKRTRAGPG